VFVPKVRGIWKVFIVIAEVTKRVPLEFKEMEAGTENLPGGHTKIG